MQRSRLSQTSSRTPIWTPIGGIADAFRCAAVVCFACGLFASTAEAQHAYSLVSGIPGCDGADNDAFQIVGDQLRTSKQFDYENRDSYTICIRTEDEAGGTYEEQFTISVNNVNEAPVNTAPDSLTMGENAALVFSAAEQTAISIEDPDAGENKIQVSLSADNGTLTMSGTNGLYFSCAGCSGDGAADASMVFQGSIADINAALDGMEFRPTTDFIGVTQVRLTSDDLGNTGEGDAQNDTDILSIAVGDEQADIALAKTADNDNPSFGDLVLFTISAVNNGVVDASDVQITDILPSGLGYKDSTATQGSYSSDNGVWNVGDLRKGDTAQLEITVQAQMAGVVENTASVTASSVPDLNKSNNVATASLAIEHAEGIPPEVEDAAPNNGDGNGDGIPDSEQDNVTSFPSAAGDVYITIENLYESGRSARAASDCSANFDVRSLAEESLEDNPSLEFPYGLTTYSFACSPVRFRIYYHGADSLDDTVFYGYGPIPDNWDLPVWYKLPDVTVGTKLVGDVETPYAIIGLSQGCLGDHTPDLPVTGLSGPARAAAIPPIPSIGPWGAGVLSLALIASAVLVVRKRRCYPSGRSL